MSWISGRDFISQNQHECKYHPAEVRPPGQALLPPCQGRASSFSNIIPAHPKMNAPRRKQSKHCRAVPGPPPTDFIAFRNLKKKSLLDQWLSFKPSISHLQFLSLYSTEKGQKPIQLRKYCSVELFTGGR